VPPPEPPRGRKGTGNSIGWKRGYCTSSKTTPSQNEITGFPETQGTRCHSIVFPLFGEVAFFQNPPFFHLDERKGNTLRGRREFPLLGVPLAIPSPENFGRNPLHSEEKKRKKIEIGREVFVFAAHVDSLPLSEGAQLLY